MTGRIVGAPIIGIVCSLERMDLPGFGVLPHHAVFEGYLSGLLSAIDASPILVPVTARMGARAADEFARDLVSILDGVVLPGGASNVDPRLYGEDDIAREPSERDPDRDATVMSLIRVALDEGVPLLGICRGMQELNVALGGTLDPAVHESEGRRDHRSRKDLPFAERYRPVHPLRLAKGGWIERQLIERGLDPTALHVNSLHGQCIDRLGRGVEVEAWADDGTIEAIRVEGAAALAFGVQWHIEWYVETTPLHASLLDAFGRACVDRARNARRGS